MFACGGCFVCLRVCTEARKCVKGRAYLLEVLRAEARRGLPIREQQERRSSLPSPPAPRGSYSHGFQAAAPARPAISF